MEKSHAKSVEYPKFACPLHLSAERSSYTKKFTTDWFIYTGFEDFIDEQETIGTGITSSRNSLHTFDKVGPIFARNGICNGFSQITYFDIDALK